MKVNLVKKQTVEDFVKSHPAARAGFNSWLQILKAADWNTPADISKTFNSADFLGKGTDRIVFNIGGNNFRLIARFLFGKSTVFLFICWIGTHKAYDTLNAKGEQYSINQY